MPHDLKQTWKTAMQEDPMWKKAVSRFIKKGYSLEELQRQHEAWKVKSMMSKSKR